MNNNIIMVLDHRFGLKILTSNRFGINTLTMTVQPEKQATGAHLCQS
jgi:hypothetical protein